VKSHEDRRREAKCLGIWMLVTVAALHALYVLVEGVPTSCGIGYFVSVLDGVPVTYVWSNLLFWLLDRYVPRTEDEAETGESAGRERIWWIAIMVGMFERALFTTFVAHDVSGVASFIVGWIGIKMVSGWQKWSTGTQYARAAVFMALLGNAMSILFGVAGGILCKLAAPP
jgi:hypothetical protein